MKTKKLRKSLWSSGLSIRPWSRSTRIESYFQQEESLVKLVYFIKENNFEEETVVERSGR